MLLLNVRKTVGFFLTVFAFYSIVIGSSLAQESNTAPKRELISGGWSYHWGDLPKNPVTGQWRDSTVLWKPTTSPSDIPGRTDENIVWLKIDLPTKAWRDPYLFINSVDLTFQAFQNNQQIYHFGEIDAEGNSQFEGWPWHIIRLPDDYQDHPLYLRIYSDYPYIGLSGAVAIGDRFSLLNEVYTRGIMGLSFILIVLLVGIISTIMGSIKKDSSTAISTGLLSFNLAIMMFAENELSQVVWFSPLNWRYIAAFCYFLIPVFLSGIIIAWLKDKTPKVAYGVLVASSLFVLVVAALSAFTEFNFINAYPYFDVLFILLVLALVIGCYQQFKTLDLPGVIMIFGILTLFISLLLDMLSAHNLITWIGRSGQWGLISFSLASLAIYLVQDWKQQIALAALTEHLEAEVEHRTKELHSSKKQLEKLAREDFLTSLLNRRSFAELATTELSKAIRFNRPLSLLLFDIDHFKDINDQYGHNVGDLVLKAIASTTKETCREGELICRYGGEEFVILLHATDAEYAHVLADRLRNAINNIEIKHNDLKVAITASFGLVCLDKPSGFEENAERLLERLLASADKLMYKVKVSGRDAVMVSDLAPDTTSVR
ncbi:sensor domain-containing diguanylate cyclase [Alkalimarinus alittae]|uniref:diguanylate cyclase n=1 Tax=Alkalimarinus alittae TaxID=2961619 RepID=A0ABY6N3W2_9ALTE|nr:diguanylate cyclase [Alkalimarinus alittae]UZE96779.1 diguanylate cyclase [Alkalimarinus alittae]